MGTVDGGECERLAPVTPLFGSSAATDASPADRWHPTWRDDPRRAASPSAADADADGDGGAFGRADGSGEHTGRRETQDDSSQAVEQAEKTLLRRLRTRSLSIREARSTLGAFALEPHQTDDLLDTMIRLGYLDDAALAEQLVHAGVERRGQGRQVIAQTLAKRGVPRDVADAALAQMPDDDFERALEFARRKAGGIGGQDAQAALRRLSGQLARRGYPSSVAMSAARQALDEVGGSGRGGGSVRFS
jgi:regulatory protein